MAEGEYFLWHGEGHSEDIQLKGQDASSIYSETNYFYHEDTKAYENSKGEKVTDDWFVSLDTTVMPKRAEDGLPPVKRTSGEKINHKKRTENPCLGGDSVLLKCYNQSLESLLYFIHLIFVFIFYHMDVRRKQI